VASTYEPIASVTLGSDAANIEFTSISGSFTDLVVVAFVRGTTAAATETIYLRVNGDTGNNYSATTLFGTGSSAASGRTSSTSLITGGGIYAANASANLFSAYTINLMSYANTNVNKTVLTGTATAGAVVNRIVGLWRSTNAITTVTIFPGSNNLKSGSTASLYGIKASA
jgi:hypothetical protein